MTGASGFIAGHIVALLLDEGYKVKGTVRNLQDTAKVAALKLLQDKHQGQLELIEADLTKPESWEKCVISSASRYTEFEVLTFTLYF